MSHAESATTLAVIAACFLLWGLVAARLERWDVSAPIAFVVLGLVVTHGPTTIVHVNLHSSAVRTLAEIALALVLFVDASRVNARRISEAPAIPLRLLGLGLPMTIAAGAVVAAALFASGGWWVAAVIGAIVAPTDAALGASIMEDERVPGPIRRVLNVESGLNDGIVTPFVNLFLAGALTSEAVRGAQTLAAAVVDLVGGAGIGVGIGLAGALLVGLSRRHGWSSPNSRALALVALALSAFGCAVVAGTNGFIAAFVAGMAFGTADHRADAEQLELAEQGGTLLSLLVWFFFGALMLVPGLEYADWRDVVFAVLALTAVRMVPVALSLLGSGLDRTTVAFVGWFGPRGLASIVFGLIAVDACAPEQSKEVLAAVTLTVAGSVLLHGVTAGPFAARYGSRMSAHPAADPPPAVTVRTLRGRRPSA